jgi:hypothetical protein
MLYMQVYTDAYYPLFTLGGGAVYMPLSRNVPLSRQNYPTSIILKPQKPVATLAASCIHSS